MRALRILAVLAAVGAAVGALAGTLDTIKSLLESKANRYSNDSYLKVQRITRTGIDFESHQGSRKDYRTETTSFEWSNVAEVAAPIRRGYRGTIRTHDVTIRFRKSVDVILSETSGGHTQTQHGLDSATTFSFHSQSDANKLKKLVESLLAELRPKTH